MWQIHLIWVPNLKNVTIWKKNLFGTVIKNSNIYVKKCKIEYLKKRKKASTRLSLLKHVPTTAQTLRLFSYVSGHQKRRFTHDF